MRADKAEDALRLKLLDLYAGGDTIASIAERLGMSQTGVRRRIREVITEDCLHDPEAVPYWAENPKGKPL